MHRALPILAVLLFITLPAHAQDHSSAAPASSSDTAAKSQPSQSQTTQVDGIAARIGNDVLTNSEVRELEDYQKLVEGQSQSRAQITDELIDQWIVETDALATKFPHPTTAEITQEFQALLKEFPSREEFQTRLSQIGLTQDQVRQVLERQLYYARFLSYKFHAATQVTAAQIQSYYQREFIPELQKRHLSAPPLTQVDAQIRQLLTQEQINEKAAQWFDEAKARLRIIVQPAGGGG